MRTTFVLFSKKIITLSFCICFIINGYSQTKPTESPIILNLRMENMDGDPIREITGDLYANNKLVSSIPSGNDGIISFHLEINTIYTIELHKDKYVTKKVEINTTVPNYEKQKFGADAGVLMFIPCEGLDISILKSPVVKIIYNDMKRDFLPDKTYEKIMMDKLSQLMENNEKCIEEKYNSVVRKADRQFDEKKYNEALLTYNQALDMRPSDEYVKNRISEINKILSQQKTNDKLYNDYITQADLQFNNKKYPLAKEFYKRALGLKPTEAYPKSQIDIIDKLLADKNKEDQDKLAIETKFQQLMSQGDNGMINDICGKAISSFNEALKLKPDDATAKQKAAEADKRCKELQAKSAQDKNKQDKYNAAIAAADKLFQAAKYEEAKKTYQDALALIPGSEYPQKQVQVIDDKVNKMNKQAQEEKAAKEKEQEANYKNLIKQGDLSIDDDVCGKALQSYKDALAIKPGDAVAQQKINDADKKCKELQAKATQDKNKQDKYNAAIAAADKLFQAAKYDEAKKTYQDALALIPGSDYPQKQVQIIDDKVNKMNKQAQEEKAAKEKEQETNYKNLIKQGDLSIDDDACGKALQSYKDALAIKPGDAVAQQKINEANAKCKELQANAANLKKQKENYNAKILEADKYFKAANYGDAKRLYQEALSIDPNADYAISQLKMAEDNIKRLAKEAENAQKNKEKETEQQYKSFIKQGDNFYDNEDFVNAKTQYQKALEIKANEQYPKEKIKEIESIIAEQLRVENEKKAKQAQYDKVIAIADAAFKEKKFDNAKTSYLEANKILPSEAYPKQKLNEIEDLIESIANQKERDYALKIQSGDKNFAAKNYKQSRQDYQDALNIKNESYPTQRISDIDKILAEQARLDSEKKAKQDSYNNAIAKADNQFKSQQYDNALISYKEASAYLPDEKYPYTKIDEINKIKKQQALDNSYKQAITTADGYFQKKQYESSKTAYNQALNSKPNDQYAKSQIEKADKEIADQLKKLSDQKAKQDAYDKAISDGDKAFTAKDYDNSKTSYQTAQAIFADKPSPKQRIDEIDKIQKQLVIDKSYKQAIDEADQLFVSKNYPSARTKYQDASGIKPSETYPPQKIKEIDGIIAQKEADNLKKQQTEKAYNEVIAKANELFDKTLHDAAKKEYEKALSIMPDESFPKMRIARINEIKSSLAKEEAKAKLAKAQSTGTTATGTSTGADLQKIADLKFKNSNEREEYLKTLLTKYPEGISCEVYKESKRTIIRYVVIRSNQANDYREVRHNWGGIDYIKNDKPISKIYFDTQVRSREGEYFNKKEL